ncbi:hypothetical protein L218DRAFT_951374 [Marasmius fiardii PR-910]|nr:hypothetical protein L218DRAFT_951374 [Marasmius fiardii PR-910]
MVIREKRLQSAPYALGSTGIHVCGSHIVGVDVFEAGPSMLKNDCDTNHSSGAAQCQVPEWKPHPIHDGRSRKGRTSHWIRQKYQRSDASSTRGERVNHFSEEYPWKNSEDALTRESVNSIEIGGYERRGNKTNDENTKKENLQLECGSQVECSYICCRYYITTNSLTRIPLHYGFEVDQTNFPEPNDLTGPSYQPADSSQSMNPTDPDEDLLDLPLDIEEVYLCYLA